MTQWTGLDQGPRCPDQVSGIAALRAGIAVRRIQAPSDPSWALRTASRSGLSDSHNGFEVGFACTALLREVRERRPLLRHIAHPLVTAYGHDSGARSGQRM